MLQVDDRAGSVSLIPLFPPELVAKRRLEAGDIAFFGNGPEGMFTFPIGIEYKSVSECVQSIINKRFVGEQFPKMANLYRRIYVIIDGEYKEGPDGKLVIPRWVDGKLKWISHGWSMSYRQFDNWQNSLAETGKVIFKSVPDRKHAASAILNLYYCWTRDYESHKSLFQFDKSQIPPSIPEPSLVRLVAAQIPGIGWKKSEAVEQSFLSVRDLATAEESEWLNIQGIGKTLSTRIVRLLRTPS